MSRTSGLGRIGCFGRAMASARIVLRRPKTGSSHPRLILQIHQPVLYRGYPPQIIFYVLLGDESRGNVPSIGVLGYDPEDPLAEENPL